MPAGERGDGADERQDREEPGDAALPELAEEVEAACVPVVIRVEGAPIALPSAVDVSAYRNVQEALTNVPRHAPRATPT